VQIVLVVGSTDYVLAHGADMALGNHFGPDNNDSHDSEKIPQEDPRLRGAYRKIQNRDNLVSTIRFGVEVEFATMDLASAYQDNYHKDLPAFGALEKRYAGGAKTRWEQAHVTTVTCTRSGVTVFIRYNIRASQQTFVAAP